MMHGNPNIKEQFILSKMHITCSNLDVSYIFSSNRVCSK